MSTIQEILEVVERCVLSKYPSYGHGSFGEPERYREYHSGEELWNDIQEELKLLG